MCQRIAGDSFASYSWPSVEPLHKSQPLRNNGVLSRANCSGPADGLVALLLTLLCPSIKFGFDRRQLIETESSGAGIAPCYIHLLSSSCQCCAPTIFIKSGRDEFCKSQQRIKSTWPIPGTLGHPDLGVCWIRPSAG